MRIRGKFLAATALILAAGLSTATGPAARASVQGSGTGCPPGTIKISSSNWAGYIVCAPVPPERVSAVNTSFTVPGPIPPCEECAVVWNAGLDGYSSDTEEQAGVLAVSEGGTVSYYTFWQMYPADTGFQIVGTAVAPGDRIQVSVQEEGTSRFVLSVTDLTKPGNSFTTTQTCSACQASSGEVLTQAVSGPDGLYPLADFGTVSMTGISATVGTETGGLQAFPNVEVTMTGKSGTVLAQPGPLNAPGTSFSTAWMASS